MTHEPVAPEGWIEQWAHRGVYTVLDLRHRARDHFLRAWRAWRADSSATRCAKLHFVALVEHAMQRPTPTATTVDTDPCARELDAAWPFAVPGMHRLEFEHGQIVLTLVFAPLAQALSNLWLRADWIGIELGVEPDGIGSEAQAPSRSRPRANEDDGTELAKGVARLAGDHCVLQIDRVAPSFELSNSMLKAIRNAGFIADPDASDSAIPAIADPSAARIDSNTAIGAASERIGEYRFAPKWRVRRHEPPSPALLIDPQRLRVAANRVLTSSADALNVTDVETDHVLRASKNRTSGLHSEQSDPSSDSTHSLEHVRAGSSRPLSRYDILIIGAGLSGCALAERLAVRGFDIALIDAASSPASGASGNPAGVFHPVIATDDSLASRATRAGFLYALTRWHALEKAGFAFDWRADGLVQVATSDEEQASFESALASLALPVDLVRYVSAHEASRFLGVEPAWGGLLFEYGGVADPASLCRAQLRAAQTVARVEPMFDRRVHSLEPGTEPTEPLWRAIDEHGHCIAEARIAIVANSNDASRLAGLDYAPTRPIRGQLSWVEDTSFAALRHPMIGDGYLLPRHGASTLQLTGASYELDDTDTALRTSSQRENIERLAMLVPSSAGTLLPRIDALPLTGRAALRCVTSDRMPMIGPLADEAVARKHAHTLSGAWPLDLPRRTGLYGAYGYGSRGLIWAALGAELIASQITGEPLPVPRSLADAFDPARFLMRALRQREIR